MESFMEYDGGGVTLCQWGVWVGSANFVAKGVGNGGAWVRLYLVMIVLTLVLARRLSSARFLRCWIEPIANC